MHALPYCTACAEKRNGPSFELFTEEQYKYLGSLLPRGFYINIGECKQCHDVCTLWPDDMGEGVYCIPCVKDLELEDNYEIGRRVKKNDLVFEYETVEEARQNYFRCLHCQRLRKKAPERPDPGACQECLYNMEEWREASRSLKS